MRLGASPWFLTTMTFLGALESKEPPVKLPLEWRTERAFPVGPVAVCQGRLSFPLPYRPAEVPTGQRSCHGAGAGEPPASAVTCVFRPMWLEGQMPSGWGRRWPTV